MRAKNREVNIFNMSLLDILTGMLGAFLFLMLGLVPYYTRAKNAPNPNTTPHIDTLLNVVGQWNGSGNMSIYLYDPENGWCGTNTKNPALSRGIKVDNSACNGDTGWSNAALYGHEDKRYLIVYSIDGPPSPETYRTNELSVELLAEKSNPDGSGVGGFCPLMLCTTFDASGAKPHTLYALNWIKMTKDNSKADYNLQYNFRLTDPTDGLPSGVLPSPPPAPVSATTAPASQVQPTPTPQPQSSDQPQPTPRPTTSEPAPAAPETPHSSFWNPFSWFSHSK